jgi:hypothetical protein
MNTLISHVEGCQAQYCGAQVACQPRVHGPADDRKRPRSHVLRFMCPPSNPTPIAERRLAQGRGTAKSRLVGRVPWV